MMVMKVNKKRITCYFQEDADCYCELITMPVDVTSDITILN